MEPNKLEPEILYRIGGFFILLKEDGNLRVIAQASNHVLNIAPDTSNSITIKACK